MANSYLFDTTYSASEFDASGTGARNSYRIIIGDKQGTQSSTAATEMELLDPGMNLSWQGDDTMSKAVMGGALSFTALLNDAQLATVETLMSNTNEGDVFCLFFNSTSSAAKPYWYGHLLMESVSIQVMNEKHVVDMQFTDGLGSLRGAKWEDSPGVLYTGFKKLSFYVREIVSKLPAYAAFREYVQTELSESAVPVTREIAWPEPVTPAGFEYDEADHKLDNLRVRAETFNKPKKQVERTRVLPVAPDYFSAADVLEDICNCFGATACIFDGYLNLGCRLDIATMKGNYVYDARYDYNSSSDDWTITGQYDAWDNLDADDQYNVLSGASKGFTMPISQVNITHEEGGSDELYVNGWFINRDISFLDFDRASDILQYALNNALTPESIVSLRRDKFFDFQAPQNSADDTVSLPFYEYPADASGYLGFPAKTVDELEYQSGESMRLTFGGNAQFFARNDLDLTSSSYFSKVHIGSTLIVRVRIQMTDANGDSYRLSRTVHTHALTSGDPDFIRIDNVSIYFDAAANNSNGAFFQQDKLYFRKLYNDIEWLKDDDAGYEDDGWYEIIVPHGENENSGEGYGATLFPLTQKYDGQIGYAPIGTKIKKQNGEEIDGAGVVLEESKDSATLMHYFREDIEFTLPYGNAQETQVLDFEEFYFEMGAQQYEPHAGPRGNGVASADGDWDGDVFLWKSAKADGTAYSGRYDGDTGEHFTRPDYIHFTGLRVTVGDGSEQSDLTTKITGGDGYEVVNLGSSRLGSRTGFSNNHVSGTVFAREKTADSAGSFVSGTSASDFKERLQWTGHRAGEGAGISDETYDSIHRYYGEVYINLFGKAREVYSMTLVPSPNSPAYRTLKNPFEVMEMNTFQTNKGIDEYLMPLKYSWTLNDGVSGEFIKVGQVRDITTITSDEGRPIRGGGGGIVGIGPGVDVVTAAFESKFVTDAITVDDETGDVTVISVKAGSTVFNADAISDGTTNKVFTATEQTKLTNIEQSATANQSNDFLKNRTNHLGTQTADTISNFDSAVNEVTEVAASREVTDTITVTSGVITEISIDDSVLDVDSIEVTPNKTFVSSVEQALILPTAQVANTASTNASNALAKTNLIQSDSGGVTGFTIADNVTVLSTDQVTEDVGRTFKTATEQSKLDKIGFNTGNTIVYNLDTEAAKVTASKDVTDRIATSGSGGSTKITTLTTTNGDFDVDDGRAKMGFLTSDATGITQITVSESVDIDGADVGNFFASSSGGTSTRTGVTNNRVVLITSDGKMGEVTDGSAGQFLQTDGNGRYSFAAGGGGSDVIKHFYSGGAQLAYPYSRYLPLTGDVIEQNTASSALSRTGFVAPYDGEVKKIIARSQETLGNTVLQWYKATDGTHAPATSLQSVTVNINAANTSFTYTYSTATFSKGDILSLKVDPTSDPVSSTMEFNYIVEFEFDTST